MSQNIPIANLPYLTIYGCVVSWVSATTLSISSGQVRDVNNVIDMQLGIDPVTGIGAATTLNFATTGANGLDAGTATASSLYYIYVIGDSTSFHKTATLASLQSPVSTTAPLMPFGYDSIRVVGYATTDGSANLLKFYTSGSLSHRVHTFDVGVRVLNAGASQTFAAVDCTGTLPVLSSSFLRINVLGTFTPNTAGDLVQFRPTGSLATTFLPEIVGQVTTKAASDNFSMLVGVSAGKPEFDYINSAATGATTVVISGFQYNV